jgi:hypothetical protein
MLFVVYNDEGIVGYSWYISGKDVTEIKDFI